MELYKKHLEEFKKSIAPLYEEKNKVNLTELELIRESMLSEINDLMLQKKAFIEEEKILKTIAAEKVKELYDTIKKVFPEIECQYNDTSVSIGSYSMSELVIRFEFERQRIDSKLDVIKVSIPEEPWYLGHEYPRSKNIREIFEHQKFKLVVVNFYKKMALKKEKETSNVQAV